jgi:hypothetical protein
MNELEFKEKPQSLREAPLCTSPPIFVLAQIAALSPLGERVSRDGAFASRRGTGEAVAAKLLAASPTPICGMLT